MSRFINVASSYLIADHLKADAEAKAKAEPKPKKSFLQEQEEQYIVQTYATLKQLLRPKKIRLKRSENFTN